ACGPALGAPEARLTLRHGLPIKPALSALYASVRMQRETAGECPERQRGRAVNPLAYAFVGSRPTSPTKLKLLKNNPIFRPPPGPVLCRVCRKKFPLFFKGCQRVPETPRDTHATKRVRRAGREAFAEVLADEIADGGRNGFATTWRRR